MSALHEALKTLGPADYSSIPLDDLQPFLSSAFSNGQTIVDSVPIPPPSTDSETSNRSRSDTASSQASSASGISLSNARSAPAPPEIEALQKEWKPVKLKQQENPLGMSVYKLGAKDGRGAWFARRSVHEGLGFAKWKRALEREFPETMKVQGGPGEGNIRGIGGERRVAYQNVEGLGKMEVYLLSAQFPGPTTPRDFVTMVLTSDQALSDQSGGETKVPRHFMVISKPCSHPETGPREGFIRGSYESVEFIREVPRSKSIAKSASTSNIPGQANLASEDSSSLGKEAAIRNAKEKSLSQSEGALGKGEKSQSNKTESRARGKTISNDGSGPSGEEKRKLDAAEDEEGHPIEWIMITRSDPGGSVPRFMVERGTPGGIVSDASKFLNWACAKDMDDFESDDDEPLTNGQDEKPEKHHHQHNHDKDLHNYQTNGHLAGLQTDGPTEGPATTSTNGDSIYGMVAGAAGAAGTMIASHTPAIITDHIPHVPGFGSSKARSESVSSISSVSSNNSFASALEIDERHFTSLDGTTGFLDPSAEDKILSSKDKELQKLEEKKRKLDEKLAKELAKAQDSRKSEKSDDTTTTTKDDEAIKKAEEKHDREIKKAEEKHAKELLKLSQKREREEAKAESRRRKAIASDERTKLLRELEDVRSEATLLRKERDSLRSQVGDLQAENTALAARFGRLGIQGEETLREVRAEVGKGERKRADSLRGLMRSGSFRSHQSGSSGEVLGSQVPAQAPAVVREKEEGT